MPSPAGCHTRVVGTLGRCPPSPSPLSPRAPGTSPLPPKPLLRGWLHLLCFFLAIPAAGDRGGAGPVHPRARRCRRVRRRAGGAVRGQRLVPPRSLVGGPAPADAEARPRDDLRDDRRQLHAAVPPGAGGLGALDDARGGLGRGGRRVRAVVHRRRGVTASPRARCTSRSVGRRCWPRRSSWRNLSATELALIAGGGVLYTVGASSCHPLARPVPAGVRLPRGLARAGGRGGGVPLRGHRLGGEHAGVRHRRGASAFDGASPSSWSARPCSRARPPGPRSALRPAVGVPPATTRSGARGRRRAGCAVELVGPPPAATLTAYGSAEPPPAICGGCPHTPCSLALRVRVRRGTTHPLLLRAQPGVSSDGPHPGAGRAPCGSSTCGRR